LGVDYFVGDVGDDGVGDVFYCVWDVEVFYVVLGYVEY